MIFLGLGASLLILYRGRVRHRAIDRRKLARYLPTSSDNESKLGLSFNEEVASGLSLALSVNDGLVGGGVLLGVLLGVGSSSGSLGSALLLGSLAGSLVVGEQLGISSALLLDVFGDDSCPKTNTNVMLVSSQS